MLIIWYLLSLPKPLFNDSTSTVLIDRNRILLGAHIAKDEQWRFPYNDSVPKKFKLSIIQFEDRQFYRHPGFNPFAFSRALFQNIKARKIVSGGSTLTMQVIRLSRKGKPRTVFEKVIEVILATRIELAYSKDEILALYASNAPFGGNVVGLDAASWRYFGRSAEKLSWSETATLAVLPNAPSLIFPGKNKKLLEAKRNRLLDRLYEKEIIDSLTCYLSKQEPLPGKPFPLPRHASHLLNRAEKEGSKGKLIHSTIQFNIQEQINAIAAKHNNNLKANSINNLSIIVLEVHTGNVVAYVGNVRDKDSPEYGGEVDVINAPRSTGSILKPFLYAAMLNDGEILPNSLVKDIPTQIGSYYPKNYDKGYDGAVPAKRALARSLNVPAVKMLQMYGVEKFNHILKRIGITTLDKPPRHYGLTIILGGAEAKLWDLTGIYASMGRTLNNYAYYNSKYNIADFHPPNYIFKKDDEKVQDRELEENSILNAASIYFTFKAMVEVSRPEEESYWESFNSSSTIAWKTGTSYGNRDAWAIGVIPQYVVGVWAGNANGEGRPGLTGLTAAAPVMFDAFKTLETSGWFSQPFDDMITLPVCKKSGYQASTICDEVDTVFVQSGGENSQICPYHKIIHLDSTENYQVNSECESVTKMHHKAWFVLEPVMEWYYKSKNPFYKPLPSYRNDCISAINISSMDVIYPKNLSQIYIPIDLDGKPGKTVFKAAHRNSDIEIYWHVDEEFIGITKGFHEIACNPEPGIHYLTLVDNNGESIKKKFIILNHPD